MAYIATWLNEALQTRTADLVLDETLYDLQRRSGLLDKYMPFKTYSGRNWMAYLTKSINTMASVIAPGAEIPSTQKGQFRKMSAEMIKVGLSHTYDENDQWAMRDAQALAEQRGIYVQDTEEGDGSDGSLASLLFGNIQGLVRAVYELLTFQSWQIVQFGAIDYSDPRTDGNVTLDWKDSSLTAFNHFPAALTGNALWTDYVNANGIQNLYTAVDTYIDSNGRPPEVTVMSRKALNHLLQQLSTKQAVASVFLNGTTVQGTVGLDQLNETLSRRNIAPIVTFDERTESDITPGTSNGGIRFLNADRFVFLNEGLGQRAIGSTIELKGQSGIFQRTYEKSLSPTIDVTEVVANILPTAPLISKRGFSQKVI